MLISKFPLGAKLETEQVSALSVSAIANTPGSLNVSWVNPNHKKFSGVMIRYKTGSYPTSPTDGSLAYNGTGTSFVLNNLTGGTKYNFRAFAYAKNSAGTKTVYNVITDGAQANNTTCANPVTSFAVAKTSSSSLTVSWAKPVGLFIAVRIVRKTGAYPTSEVDGAIIYEGTGTSFVDTGLAANTTYYYRAFVANGYIWNDSSATQQNYNTTKITANQVVFTSSQNWTVPAGVRAIDVFVVGGGAAGVTRVNSMGGGGGAGGGSGYTTTYKNLSVTPGASIPVVVGAGGIRANTYAEVKGSGGGSPSSFNGTIVANGGWKHTQFYDTYTKDSAGGSGGGKIWYWGTPANNGGSDGSNGGGWSADYPEHCKGQGATTKAFGETGNTLYAGGGGAGGMYSSSNASYRADGGSGGAGGGGNGGRGEWPIHGYDAVPNTGSGGGGSTTPVDTTANSTYAYGGNGSAGIVIVRWPEQ